MSNYRIKNAKRFAEAFKALSNPNRLKIFARLVACCPSGEECSINDDMSACVGELGNDLNIAPSTVSHHIKELSRAGLIRMERCGQSVRCWVDPEAIEELKRFFSLQIKETPERAIQNRSTIVDLDIEGNQ